MTSGRAAERRDSRVSVISRGTGLRALHNCHPAAPCVGRTKNQRLDCC